MIKITFVSNTVTQPFNLVKKKLDPNREFLVEHYELNQVVQFLVAGVDSDIVVILLSAKYFYRQYVDEGAFEKLDQLIELAENYRQRCTANILIGNIVDVGIAAHFDSISREKHNFKVAELNLRLTERVSKIAGCYILDTSKIARKLGIDNYYRVRSDFVFQAPYSKEAIEDISQLIAEKVNTLRKPRFKVCALDADNTLWGGVIGEDGTNNIKVDENYPGIIYSLFQEQLLALKKSGILLALVTKNNLSDVQEFFSEKLMPLKLSDFSCVKSNWNSKSQNIIEIADELNVGTESIIFIDDNLFEINEVKSVVPDVSVLQVSTKSVDENIDLLESVSQLFADKLTVEDLQKSEQYKIEKARVEQKSKYSSIDDYIASLNICIKCAVNCQNHLPRIVQLINKTNQFNLTTRRYSEVDIERMFSSAKVFDFSVSDSFGEMGLCGVLIVKDSIIDTFLLSCRVLGRKIENKMLFEVVRYCGQSLKAEYIRSAKNEQTSCFYDNNGASLLSADDDSKHYQVNFDMLKDVHFIKFIFEE